MKDVIEAGAKPGNKNAAGPHRTAADIHGFSQSLPEHVFDDDEAHQEAIYDHFHQDEHFKPALQELSKMNMKIGRVAKNLLKASSTESSDVVRAAGTSEGSMKGWEARRLSHQAGQASAHAAKHGDSFSHGLAEKSHEKAAKTHEEAAGEKGIGFDEANEHRANCLFHETLAKAHKEIQKSLPYAGKNASDIMNKASDATTNLAGEVVHCRSHSASGPVLASDKPWSPGEQVSFMWMPAGVSTICAGFRKGSIELTVNCDENTAAAVQASLESWRAERPKQEPFGCIEHKEQEASFRVGASCGFKWNEDGVYLAAEPTTLGAQNVNGRVHRSWSPSFTTDADYSKATERNGVLMFPEGARGSRSNPAQITGVDFCVGTLTNKPAFHSMSPVKASEGDDAVKAASGAFAAGHPFYGNKYSQATQKASFQAFAHGDSKRHAVASDAHHLAMADHGKEAGKYKPGSEERHAHYEAVGYHLRESQRHAELSSKAGDSAKASDATSTDSVQAAWSPQARAAAAAARKNHAGLSPEHKKAAEAVAESSDHDNADDFYHSANEADVWQAAGIPAHLHAEALDHATAHFEKINSSEVKSLDTILARQASVLEQANAIATDHGVARTTLDDVYEKVTATGTSEGSKKGWEHRSGFAFQDSQRAAHKTAAVADYTPMSGAYLTAHKNAALAHGAAAKSHKEALDGADDHYKDVHSRQAKFHEDKERSHWAGWRQDKDVKATDATPQGILDSIYARAETVTAEGNSEGAKKGWEVRMHSNQSGMGTFTTLHLEHAESRDDAYAQAAKKGKGTAYPWVGSAKMKKAAWDKTQASDPTPEEALEQIYARAGENR